MILIIDMSPVSDHASHFFSKSSNKQLKNDSNFIYGLFFYSLFFCPDLFWFKNKLKRKQNKSELKKDAQRCGVEIALD